MQGAPSRPDDAAGAPHAKQNAQPRPRRSGGGGGLQPLQLKLQQHIDREDRRIKELTESILYEFVPAALRIAAPEAVNAVPGVEMAPEQCRAVACAALIVATLMNAPPGFLEFLLCVPWTHLADIFASSDGLRKWGGEAGAALPQLLADPVGKAQLVNLHLRSDLVDCVMDFLFMEHHRESLPPMMGLAVFEYVPGGGAGASVAQLAAAAMLDRATPLHCAAARGNPAQVDHLLLCGADPLARTAAGEVPLELVPVCGDRSCSGGRPMCRCMGQKDQEAWECRSQLARTLILRRCAVAFSCGVMAWLRLLVLCALCMLGLWGRHISVQRPAILAHAELRGRRRRGRGLRQAQASLLKMRTSAAGGREELEAAASSSSAGLSDDQPPDRGRRRHQATHSGSCSTSDNDSLDDRPASATSPSSAHSYSHGGGGGAAAAAGCGYCGAADRAFSLFTAAVHTLREVRVRAGTGAGGAIIPEATWVDLQGEASVVVSGEEQAALYCGWTEAALALCEGCGCTGCAAAASHAVGTALKEMVHLLDALERATPQDAAARRRVGEQLATVVHLNARLLLRTDVQKSATRAAIWRAQQCLAEWGRLRRLGLAAGVGGDSGSGGDPLELQCLDTWSRAAGADLLLLEALQGSTVPPLQPLAEVLPSAVVYDPASGTPSLGRPVSKALVQQLEAALSAARPHASDHIIKLVESVTSGMQAEIQAGDTLRALLSARSAGAAAAVGAAAAGDQLADAISAAAKFPALAEEVAQAEALRERWAQRAKAQAHLDAVMEAASAPPPPGLLTTAAGAPPRVDGDAFWKEVGRRLQQLEEAAEEARLANIGVARAKKLLKDLGMQGAAVEAAGRLDEVLKLPRAGAAALKAALSKAEEAVAAAAGGVGAFTIGGDALGPRVQAVKAKLAVERAAESLARAAASCRSVADLPKLEAAILAARKVGAQQLDSGAYATATELRVKLDGAAKARAALEAALRSLQKLSRQEDADAVVRCTADARAAGAELLAAEVARAEDAVSAWQAATAAELRLTKALRDGAGAAALSRAIKEGAAAGVKVNEARRVLKLMQGLEVALAAAAEGPSHYQALQAKVQLAEAGGVAPGVVLEARKTLHRLMLAEVRAELDAALRTARPTEARHAPQRLATLRAVLDKATAVLSVGEDGVLDDHHHQQQQRGGHSPNGSTSGSGDGALLAAAGRSVSAASSADDHGAPTPPLLRDLGGGKLRSQDSFTSQPASSAAGSAVSTPTWTQRELLAGGNAPAAHAALALADAPSISLRLHVVGDAVAAWLEPADPGESGSSEDEEEEALSADLASDDVAVVRHMARLAWRRLAREEREQARIERERAEEARLRRGLQAREKAERERAEKERADRARAERAERKAALEAAKAERRERERAARAERERARQEREDKAREHFALLQRQRKLLAEQARQAQQAQELAARQKALYGPLSTWAGGAFASPGRDASAAVGGGGADHTRSDSFTDMLSARGLLSDILDDQPAGRGHSGGDPGSLSPALDDGGDEGALLRSLSSQEGLRHGQWGDSATVAHSENPSHVPSPDPLLPLSSSLAGADHAAAVAAAAYRSILFSDLGGASWLADHPTGPSTAGLESSLPLGVRGTGGGPSGGVPTGDPVPASSLLWGSGTPASSAANLSHFGGDEESSLGAPPAAAGLWESVTSSDGGFGGASSVVTSPAPPPSQREKELLAALSHLQQQMPCKNFLAGRCRDGDACPFSHSLSAVRSGAAMGGGDQPASLGLPPPSSTLLGGGLSQGPAPSFAFGAPGSMEFGGAGGGGEMHRHHVGPSAGIMGLLPDHPVASSLLNRSSTPGGLPPSSSGHLTHLGPSLLQSAAPYATATASAAAFSAFAGPPSLGSLHSALSLTGSTQGVLGDAGPSGDLGLGGSRGLADGQDNGVGRQFGLPSETSLFTDMQSWDQRTG